ncbi:MAG TPA: OmpA family protein [Pseudomonadota bacterium]|nr:OmpA family protein [Pseudomonadota bacterium]
MSRRRLSHLLTAACLFAATLCVGLPKQAQAQIDRNNFNTPTWDLQLFRPAIDSRGYVTVNSARNLGHLEFSLGLIGTWAFQPLYMQLNASEPYPATGFFVANRRTFSVDHLITPQLQFAIGLFKYLEVGIGIPVGIVIGKRQRCTGNTDECTGYDNMGTVDQLRYSQVMIGDLPIHIKGKFIDPLASWSKRFGVGALLSVYLPLSRWANNPGYQTFIGENNVTLRPQLIVERDWDAGRRFRTAINVGALVRFGSETFTDVGKTIPLRGSDICFPEDSLMSPSTIPCGTGLSRTLGTQLNYSLALSFAIVKDRFDLLAEVFGYADLTGAARAFPMEVLGAGKVYLATNSYLLFGAGAGVIGNGGEHTGSPRVRAFLGFIYEPRIGDRDGDGIPDSVDQCPDQPEDKDDFEDQDGCPDLDNDNDGVPDTKDKCPMVKGTWEAQGCPTDEDRDGDGIPDSRDKCPDDPEDIDQWEDDDGCPELDNDGDGIPDNLDKCPNEPETKNGRDDDDGCPDGGDRDKDGIPDELDKCPDQPEDKDGFEDQDGCPDLDNDKDRIPDKFDKCPMEPETYNGVEDEDGCPDAEKGRVMLTKGKILILDKVYFDTGKATIKPISFPILDAVSATLVGNPQLELVEIQGHADERGNDDANLRLTQARVQSVKDYVVKKGVEEKRLIAKGYGETKPLCTESNESCWEKNRRVEFVILKPAGEGAADSPPPPPPPAEESGKGGKKKKKGK